MPNFTIIQLPIPSPHPQPSCPAAASLHWVAHVESLHDTGSRHKLIILLLPSSVGLSVWICSIWKFEWASKNMQWKWSRFQYLDFQINEPINFWIIVCGSLIRQMFDDKLVNRGEINVDLFEIININCCLFVSPQWSRLLSSHAPEWERP